MDSLSDAISAKGRGNELITIYVSPKDSVNFVQSMVEQELHSLDDYDENTRMKYSVGSTLEEMKRILEDMVDIPSNGLVIFGGRVQGNTEVLVLSEKLEKPVPETRYISGSQFSTDIAQKITSRDSEAVLVLIELGTCIIGLLGNELADIQEEVNVRIPSKHSKGGQSQSRFERRREEAKKEFYNECERRIKNVIDSSSDSRIFIGGPEITVKEFVNQTNLDNRIEIINSIEYVNQTGMEKLKRESLKHLDDEERKEKMDELDDFFKSITDDLPTIYGKESVEQAIEYRAVKKLLYHTDSSNAELARRAEEYGADVVRIDGQSERERVFLDSFDGIGGILNYEIDELQG